MSRNNNKGKDRKPSAAAKSVDTAKPEGESSFVGEAIKAGGSFVGPDIAKAMGKIVFNGTTKLRNYAPFDAFLRGLGEYNGLIERLPNFTNAVVEKCIGQTVFGSDIAGDIVRDSAVRAAEGFTDAIRAAHGDELKHIGVKLEEVAVQAAAQVAAIEFAVDLAGFGHRATCKCVASDASLRRLTYADAASEGLALAQCCVPDYRRNAKTHIQPPGRRERSALDVLGSLPYRDREAYLAWVRSLTIDGQPSLGEQAIAMHALVELDTEGELIGFMALNDEERYRHLDLLKERVEKRLSVKGEVDELVNRLKAIDKSVAAQAAINRQACSQPWGRLSKPTPMRILGILGL